MNQILDQVSNIIFLIFVMGIPFYGAYKKINVFDAFINGAKDGFQTAVNLVPYLIAMIVAIGMLRASGFFEILQHILQPLLLRFNLPIDLVPLILIRPFSGGASNGILADIIHRFGGDAPISKTAATIVGATETTFYIVAVYFGTINIRHTRYAIPAGLLADLFGVIVAVVVCRFVFF
jgi:spore maturation protein B